MKMLKLKKTVFLYSVLFSTIVLNTSFGYKKAGAFMNCTWYANSSAIMSVGLDDDASQFFYASNIAQSNSWTSPTMVPLLSTTINITTLLGKNHPAGVLKIYCNGVLVKTHSVSANTLAGFLDTFTWSGPNPNYEVVW